MGQNVDVVRGAYEAFGRGDVESVLAAMDPKIEWNEAENVTYDDGTTWIGPDEVLNRLFVRLGGEWDGFTVHVQELFGAGDRVVMQGRYTATYKETGRALDCAVVHVWTLRDGKLARFEQYTDTLQFADVTGDRDREILRRGALS